MAQFSITSLKDKALDVDPDLRYMALEDLKSYLKSGNNLKTKSIESFIPILFRLLKDSNSHVQSQAVNTFPVIAEYISSESVLDMVKNLYSEMLLENAKENNSRITISIPSMTLRYILDAGSFFTKQLWNSITSTLLDELVRTGFTVDSIEVLIDLLKNSKSALSPEQRKILFEKAISSIDSSDGLVSTRSFVVFELLMKSDNRNADLVIADTLNEIFKNSGHEDSRKGRSTTLRLLSIFLREGGFTSIIHEDKIDLISADIYKYIKNSLNLEDLLSADQMEDIDFDELISENSLREDALNTLNEMIHAVASATLKAYFDDIVEIVLKLISYNPLSDYGHSSDSYSFSEGSSIEFSDDEEQINFREGDGDDDGTWKLRDKAIIIVDSLIVSDSSLAKDLYRVLFPYLLSGMKDNFELVSERAIGALMHLLDILNAKCHKEFNISQNSSSSRVIVTDTPMDIISEMIPLLEKSIIEVLHIESRSKFPIVIKLIICILRSEVKTSKNFLDSFFSLSNSSAIAVEKTNEMFSLYKAIIENDELYNCKDIYISKILSDISNSILNDKTYHHVLLENLDISSLLFQHARSDMGTGKISGALNTLLNGLIGLATDKSFSSILKEKSLGALTQACIGISLDPNTVSSLICVFEQSLKDEFIMDTATSYLVKIFEPKSLEINSFHLRNDFVSFIIFQLTAVLSTTERANNYNSLKLLSLVLSSISMDKIGSSNLNELCTATVNLARTTNDGRTMSSIFDILSKIMTCVQIELSLVEIIVKEIINKKLNNMENLSDYSFTQFLKIISQLPLDFDLFDAFTSCLDLKTFVAARAMAVIVVSQNRKEAVEKCMREVESALSGNKDYDADKLIFDIHFLGNVAGLGYSPSPSIDMFLRILDSGNDEVNQASARAIGLTVAQDIKNRLNSLLASYQSNNRFRKLNLISLNQILNSDEDIDNDTLKLIWDTIWKVVSSYNDDDFNKVIPELKLSGDTLYKICMKNEVYSSQIIGNVKTTESLSKIYICISILKLLISRVEVSSLPELNLLEECLSFLQIQNIEVKQALVGTLSTGIYSNPSLLVDILGPKILPAIYNELPMKQEFKKIIPMGPYKYIIDEGLEIRKICYEMLYSVMSMDPNMLDDKGVDLEQMGKVIMENGLVDSEVDIVVLASIDLSHLVNSYPKFLLSSPDVLPSLIGLLRKNLSKKLKSKASSQEIESYNEGLKSIISLSKSINKCLVANESTKPNWIEYYAEMRTGFSSVFSVLEV